MKIKLMNLMSKIAEKVKDVRPIYAIEGQIIGNAIVLFAAFCLMIVNLSNGNFLMFILFIGVVVMLIASLVPQLQTWRQLRLIQQQIESQIKQEEIHNEKKKEEVEDKYTEDKEGN